MAKYCIVGLSPLPWIVWTRWLPIPRYGFSPASRTSDTHVRTSATIGTQTGAIVASVFSAKSSLGTMTSQATTSLFSENAIASSASGHSSSLSASAASATSSNGAMPIGNIWVSVFAGGLMLAGGIVAGL